jgi:hypothetical protein
MKSLSSKKVLLIILIFINLSLLYYLINPSFVLKANTPSYPEITELANKHYTFTELKQYFTKLAETKGGAYAYEVLKQAAVPPQTDMHLLGHVVGDQLYRQQGIEGIKVCTDDFRNACSHSIVVGLLLDKGETILPEIAKTCKEAPGGTGAYTMCYHGLGHGVLAYTNYNLPASF